MKNDEFCNRSDEFVQWPGTIAANSVSNDLFEFIH